MGGSAPFPSVADHAAADAPPLSSLLDALARDRPEAALLHDAAGRESWSGRPARRLAAGEARDAARGLASRLRALKLPAGSAVGICLPNGSELCLSLLAAEQAGLVPVLMPATGERDELERIVDVADLGAVVTQARLGQARPACLFREIAARRFRLRFLLGFGPDVPDGVIDLDAPEPAAGGASRSGGGRPTASSIATVGESGRGPTFRTGLSSIAAAAVVVAAARWRAGDTVATTVAPDDLKGLAAGWLACLVAGAACEAHPGLDRERLAAALARPGRTHLVLPGWTEEVALAAGLCEGAASVLFVHPSPAGLPAETRPAFRSVRIVDAVSFGEAAIVAAARDRDGKPGIRLDAAYPPGSRRPLVELRRAPGGGVEARGVAVAGGRPGDAPAPTVMPPDAWRPVPSA